MCALLGDRFLNRFIEKRKERWRAASTKTEEQRKRTAEETKGGSISHERDDARGNAMSDNEGSDGPGDPVQQTSLGNAKLTAENG